jgi:hypothetical protein
VVKAGRRRIKFKTHLSRDTLTISLRGSVSSATVTTSAPAIAVGARLAANVRRHKVKRLTVVLLVKDQRDKSTVLIDGLKV